MILEELVNQLKIIAESMNKNKDSIKTTVIEEDGFTESIYKDDNGGYVLKAGAGYNSNVDILCTIDDTNNGYIAYIPSYSSSMQDNYICMDYSEADYLRKLLNFIHEQK